MEAWANPAPPLPIPRRELVKQEELERMGMEIEVDECRVLSYRAWRLAGERGHITAPGYTRGWPYGGC